MNMTHAAPSGLDGFDPTGRAIHALGFGATAILIGGLAFAAPSVALNRGATVMPPGVLCSTPGTEPTVRPKSVVTTLRSEPLAGSPGKWMTVQLVRYPPGALTPAHRHGGDVTAYVLEGTVRSEHSGLPAADYPAGQSFHEPFGTTHVFIENPSLTQPAAILAITVHDEGAALLTFVQ